MAIDFINRKPQQFTNEINTSSFENNTLFIGMDLYVQIKWRLGVLANFTQNYRHNKKVSVQFIMTIVKLLTSIAF